MPSPESTEGEAPSVKGVHSILYLGAPAGPLQPVPREQLIPGPGSMVGVSLQGLLVAVNRFSGERPEEVNVWFSPKNSDPRERKPEAYEYGDALRINVDDIRVEVDGASKELSPKGFAILAFFARNPDQAFTPAEIYRGCWPGQDPSRKGMDGVRVQMTLLRNALYPARDDPRRGIIGPSRSRPGYYVFNPPRGHTTEQDTSVLASDTELLGDEISSVQDFDPRGLYLGLVRGGLLHLVTEHFINGPDDTAGISVRGLARAAGRLFGARTHEAITWFPVDSEMGEEAEPEIHNYGNGSLLFNVTSTRVVVDGISRDLASKQLDLLTFFARNPSTVTNIDEIWAACWPERAMLPADESTIRAAVSRLRSTLYPNKDDPRRSIVTFSGGGYRFTPPEPKET